MHLFMIIFPAPISKKQLSRDLIQPEYYVYSSNNSKENQLTCEVAKE